MQLAPAAGPRVQHIGRLPIGSLTAGTYELRILVATAHATCRGPRISRCGTDPDARGSNHSTGAHLVASGFSRKDAPTPR